MPFSAPGNARGSESTHAAGDAPAQGGAPARSTEPGGAAHKGAGYAGASTFRQSQLPSKPRRVRGGIRLNKRDAAQEFGWAGARLLSLVRSAATEEAMREGAEYANLGQTRAMAIEPGRIIAAVQGRQARAYRTTIEMPVIPDDSWEKLIRTMVEQALHAAKLLSGELPPAAEELFAAQGLEMFPATAQGLRVSCNCGEAAGDSAASGGRWCKHACCVALLTADALRRDPFQWFGFRGIAGEDLLERIRQHRSALRPAGAGAGHAASAGPGGAGAGAARQMGSAQGLSGAALSPPLENCLDSFWEAGLGLDEVETRVAPPAVTHALLKRLGPSPFKESRFPMFGLLATCYDTISGAAIREADPTRLKPPPRDQE